MSRTQTRREQRPDPLEDSKGLIGREVPIDDPNYHYRIVSLENETSERIAYHRDLGYGIAKETNRFAVMGCRREEHELRQQESAVRANRLREGSHAPVGDMVKDETTIEVTRGLTAQNEDE